jgi:hypothetical protein
MYEETEEGESSAIPFIMVPTEETMPTLLYIFESRNTDEVEPGMDGEDVPIVEWDLHQYADMAVLKENLSSETYDEVRTSLGLEPLAVATKKGEAITESVRTNLN